MPTLLTTRDRDRRADRASRGSLPGESGRRAVLRFTCRTGPTRRPKPRPATTTCSRQPRAGIARLNQRHGPGPAGARFLLLHRRRIWDEAEGVWMGWERKRGKLHELNRLLRGGMTDTTFVASDGHPPAVPDGVRYVITLDADTRLPRGVAKRMVGKMAHPLNAPRFDKQCRPRSRRSRSYAAANHGVIADRPRRIGISSASSRAPPESIHTPSPFPTFTRIFSMKALTAAKGFTMWTCSRPRWPDRVPDNTLLSHDLFEGTFARSGLVSDIELVEEFPSRYDVAAARQHRWARGDWQLLPWILGRAHGSNAARATAAAARRSIVDSAAGALENDRQPAPHAVGANALLALVAGWTLAAGAAAIWTGVHRRDDRDGADAPVRDRNPSAAPRHLQAQPHPRGRHRPGGGALATRDDADPARASGVADD